VGIDRVRLLDQRPVLPALDGDLAELAAVLESGVEGEDDVRERHDVALGLAVLVDGAVLHEAEPPDVVGGPVAPGHDDVDAGGDLLLAREEGVEADGRAAGPLPEHPEPTGQSVGEREGGGVVGGDGEADGGGGGGVGGAVDAAPEPLAQRAGDEGEPARTAHEVDAGDIPELAVAEPGDERAHHVDGRLDQGRGLGVELGHGDDDGVARHLDGDAARLGREVLLGLPALLEQPRPGARAHLRAGGLGLGEGALGEHLVEVVPTEVVDAHRAEHVVARAVHVHERGVEGAAAEVVDDHAGAARVQGAALAVGVLEPRGGRFVDHPRDGEAGPAEGLERQEALRAVGVRGHRDHRGAGLEAGGHARRRREGTQQGGQEAREHLEDREGAAADKQRCDGRHVRGGEDALERLEERGAVVRGLEGLEAEEELVPAPGHDRGEVLVRVAVGVHEADDGIVAAIDPGDDGPGGAEVNSEMHW